VIEVDMTRMDGVSGTRSVVVGTQGESDDAPRMQVHD
jgi:hypothetical protein